MKNLQTTVDFEIVNNARENDTLRPRIRPGKVVSVGLYVFGEEPSENVNIRIETEKGEPIIEAVTYKNLLPESGGGYVRSFKPVDFEGSQNIEIFLTSKLPLTNGFKGQLVFNIDHE